MSTNVLQNYDILSDNPLICDVIMLIRAILTLVPFYSSSRRLPDLFREKLSFVFQYIYEKDFFQHNLIAVRIFIYKFVNYD